jgi:DNA modification methylase
LTYSIIEADCVEAMQAMDEASVDAIVTDPPYGLEFMGKEWDRLDHGLPQENVWKGRRGKGGSNIGTDDTKPASRHHVALGMGKRHQFKRCLVCGKRQFSGSPCECAEPEWTIETPPGTPSSSIRAQRWHQAWATEALRVLKPGGHLLAFGGTRTHHRLACAIEDAGFEIRDSVIWLYGSGFPKSLDVSKAIDKASGAEREVVGTRPRFPDGGRGARPGAKASFGGGEYQEFGAEVPVTAPATPEAQQWQGWGTALKPAHEPIVLARKPLIGTVVQNCLEHGTGAINVDGCRIGHDEPIRTLKAQDSTQTTYQQAGRYEDTTELKANGRWPANCALSHLPECEDGYDAPGCPVAELDRQSGEASFNKAGKFGDRKGKGTIYGGGDGLGECDVFGYGDRGGASRFFATFQGDEHGEQGHSTPYDPRAAVDNGEPRGVDEGDIGLSKEGARFRYVAKASRAERNAGLDGFEERDSREWRTGNAPPNVEHRVPDKRAQNSHPTVKPIDLMRWLVRLVTPPGGTVLDPFAGSGTTGIAATLEGFDFIGIEREAEYVEIAKARIEHWQKVPQGTETKAALKQEAKERKRKEKEAQDGLF